MSAALIRACIKVLTIKNGVGSQHWTVKYCIESLQKKKTRLTGYMKTFINKSYVIILKKNKVKRIYENFYKLKLCNSIGDNNTYYNNQIRILYYFFPIKQEGI